MKRRKKIQLIKQTLSFFVDFLIAGLIVLAINSFLAQSLRVEGKSMFPFLDHGDFVLINKIAYLIESPKKDEIIGFYDEDLERKIVKRIVGVAGDEVDFKDHMIYVNGLEIADPASTKINSDGNIDYPFIVPEKGYFVLGDNYNQSIDSRFEQVGIVKEEEIIGRIDFRLWPLGSNLDLE